MATVAGEQEGTREQSEPIVNLCLLKEWTCTFYVLCHFTSHHSNLRVIQITVEQVFRRSSFLVFKSMDVFFH